MLVSPPPRIWKDELNAVPRITRKNRGVAIDPMILLFERRNLSISRSQSV